MKCLLRFDLLKMKALALIVLITAAQINTLLCETKNYDLSSFHNYSKSDESSAYFTSSKIPLLWVPSSHALQTGFNYVTLALNITSPCDALLKLNTTVQNKPNFETSFKFCNRLFRESILSVFDECPVVAKPALHIKTSTSTDAHRAVRMFFFNAIAQIATAITAVVALGISVFNTVQIHQLHSEVNNFNEEFEGQVKKLKDLSDTHLKILDEVEKHIKALAKKVDEVERSTADAEFLIFYNNVINQIQRTSDKLKSFMHEFKKGHVSSNFESLFPNIDLCPNYTCTSTDYFKAVQCERTEDGLVLLKIDAVLTDPKSKVFEAKPFSFFLPKNNDPQTICAFDFQGVRYVLHNGNSNCASPLVTFHPTKENEAVPVFDYNSCPLSKPENSFFDFTSNYKMVRCENITSAYKYSGYKLTAKHVAVYCNELMLILPDQKIAVNCSNLIYFVPHNTTIAFYNPYSKTTTTYPAHTTRLSSSDLFTPDSELFEIINRQINFPKLNGENVDDFSQMEKLMNEYRKKSKTLGERIDSFKLKSFVSDNYTVIILIGLLLFLIIGFAVYCCCCNKKCPCCRQSKVTPKVTFISTDKQVTLE